MMSISEYSASLLATKGIEKATYLEEMRQYAIHLKVAEEAEAGWAKRRAELLADPRTRPITKEEITPELDAAAENVMRGIGPPVTLKLDTVMKVVMFKAEEAKARGPSPWQLEQEAAMKRTASLIGNVMLANAKYHQLELSDPTFGASAGSDWINRSITEHNQHAEEYSFAGVMNMQNALSHAGLGNVVSQKETGEYKLNAFKIFSATGKLVSELTDQGHYREYNEDGTLGREMSRLDTSSLPSILDNIHPDTWYGYYAHFNAKLYEDTEFF